MYDDNDIREAQLNDPAIYPIITSFESDNAVTVTDKVQPPFKRELDQLTIIDGILYYKYRGKSLIVAPKSLYKEILELSHSNHLTEHFGSYKTHRMVLNRFWWPNCFKDVSDYVTNCLLCLKTKHPRHKEGFMGVKPWPVKPLDLVSIDFLVDLPV